MYLKYYSLQEKPFQITADPKYFWMGEKQREALSTLQYGITEKRGFLLLTGEVGTGKTVMINYIVSQLDINTVVATLPDPDLESMDFYNMLADGFDMEETFDSKGAFLIHLREFLQKSYAEQKHLLLIIDESQRLNPRLMEDLRVLSNIELHDQKLINIFFVGQQEFNNILLTRQNRALAQRITARYHIQPLTMEETGAYIAHRLKIGGSEKKIFKPSAIKSVYGFSGGVPRLINIICDHALMTGYSRNMRQLDAKVISDCAEELRIPHEKISASAATLKSADDVGEGRFKDSGAEDATPAQPMAAASGSDTEKGVGAPVQQPMGWRPVYAGVIILMVVLVAFAITQFTGGQAPRWDEEDLTPQKYKTTLEKEKEMLSSRMSGETEAPVVQAPTTEPTLPPGGRHLDKGDASGHRAAGAVGMDSGEAPPMDGSVRAAPAQDQGDLEPLPLMKEKIIIQFELNSNDIEEHAYAILDRIAAYLANNVQQRIFVKGYTDASGPTSYNESVSRFRANAVKSYLKGKGAKPHQIEVFGMGDKNPIASNNTAEGRRLNRRVEIEFSQGNAPSDL